MNKLRRKLRAAAGTKKALSMRVKELEKIISNLKDYVNDKLEENLVLKSKVSSDNLNKPNNDASKTNEHIQIEKVSKCMEEITSGEKCQFTAKKLN